MVSHRFSLFFQGRLFLFLVAYQPGNGKHPERFVLHLYRPASNKRSQLQSRGSGNFYAFRLRFYTREGRFT